MHLWNKFPWIHSIFFDLCDHWYYNRLMFIKCSATTDFHHYFSPQRKQPQTHLHIMQSQSETQFIIQSFVFENIWTLLICPVGLFNGIMLKIWISSFLLIWAIIRPFHILIAEKTLCEFVNGKMKKIRLLIANVCGILIWHEWLGFLHNALRLSIRLNRMSVTNNVFKRINCPQAV